MRVRRLQKSILGNFCLAHPDFQLGCEAVTQPSVTDRLGPVLKGCPDGSGRDVGVSVFGRPNLIFVACNRQIRVLMGTKGIPKTSRSGPAGMPFIFLYLFVNQ